MRRARGWCCALIRFSYNQKCACGKGLRCHFQQDQSWLRLHRLTIPDDWTVADMLAPTGRRVAAASPHEPDAGQGHGRRSACLPGPIRADRELVDGVLVEKIMEAARGLAGRLYPPSVLAVSGGSRFGESCLALTDCLRTLGRQIRVPDVSFIRWEKKDTSPVTELYSHPRNPRFGTGQRCPVRQYDRGRRQLADRPRNCRGAAER